MTNWTLDQVVEMLNKQATSYIAGRKCQFLAMIASEGDPPVTEVRMIMEAGHISQRRSVEYHDGDSVMEILDVAMVGLTHMAVNCGLIETTPKKLTHHINVIGEDWENTEVQIDGHSLRGVFSLELAMKAGEQHSVKLGFSRSKVHLDQKFLPSNMQIQIEGMDNVLGLLRQVTDAREELMKSLSHAKLHSSDEEVALYREIYDALKLYEAVLDEPVVIDSEAVAEVKRLN